MRNLITWAAAKAQIRMDHDLDDEDIMRKRDNASAIILEYLETDSTILKHAVNNGLELIVDGVRWIDQIGEPCDTLPGNVNAATLLVLAALYDNRDGDDWRVAQHLSQSVIDLLRRKRVPAMA